MHLPPEILAIIAVALIFDFSNGFHDAANSIATVVSTRVMSPRVAVVWAAFFNFIAFAVFGVHVAKTIAKGTVDPSVVSHVGEKVDASSREKLLRTINQTAPKIMEQYKASGVDFSVVVKDNQVVIKAKPKT